MKTPGDYQKDIHILEKQNKETLHWMHMAEKELMILKELMGIELEIYREFIETDEDATQFQKGKNRGFFFAYKRMIDSINSKPSIMTDPTYKECEYGNII